MEQPKKRESHTNFKQLSIDTNRPLQTNTSHIEQNTQCSPMFQNLKFELEESKQRNSDMFEIKETEEDLPKQQSLSAKTKNRALISMLLGLSAIYSIVTLIASLLPQMVQLNYKGINFTLIGIIMSCQELAAFLSMTLIGSCMKRIGRNRAMIIGLLMVSLCTIGQGLISTLKNQWQFYPICLALRLIQGVFYGSFYQSACFSLITNLFSENSEKYMGYALTSTGVGVLLGPVIGSALFKAIGYRYTFMVFGLYLFVNIIHLIIFIPSDQEIEKYQPTDIIKEVCPTQENLQTNDKLQPQNVSIQKGRLPRIKLSFETNKIDPQRIRTNSEENKIDTIKNSIPTDSGPLPAEYLPKQVRIRVRYPLFFKVFKSAIGLIAGLITTFFLYSPDSIISIALTKEFDVQEDQIGYIFIAPMCLFTLGCLTASFISKKIERRVCIAFGQLMCCIGNFLMGPSQIFNFPKKLYLLIIGYSLQQCGCAFQLMPALSEILTVTANAYHLSVDDQVLNNKCSAIFNAFYTLGAVLGPIISGQINDKVGYRKACDILGFVNLGFFVFYLFSNVRLKDFKCINHTKVAPLPQITVTRDRLSGRLETNDYLNGNNNNNQQNNMNLKLYSDDNEVSQLEMGLGQIKNTSLDNELQRKNSPDIDFNTNKLSSKTPKHQLSSKKLEMQKIQIID